MIQTALFFILGFLSALFLALLVSPAIWRRAVLLTRRRLETSLPLTMDEINADKDRLKAEHAVATRQLEMTIRSQRDKIATHLVQEGRHKEELAAASEDAARKDAGLSSNEAQLGELRNQISAQSDREQELLKEIAAQEEKIKSQAGQVDRLGRMYDEASFSASSRQIELVAQEAKLEKLSDDVMTLRAEVKATNTRKREAEVEAKAMDAALKDEHKKLVSLENKAAQLTASLTDAEERAERRESEVARLREQMKDKAVPADTGENANRLEERIKTLMRENKKLRSSLATAKSGANDERADGEKAKDAAMLREQIGALAAEVVHLTASLEGVDSPIYRSIENDGSAAPKTATPRSLADRIRALRDAETARRD